MDPKIIHSIVTQRRLQTDEKINFDGWKLTPRVYSKFAILTFFDWVSMSKKTEINYERETEGRDRLYRCSVSTD